MPSVMVFELRVAKSKILMSKPAPFRDAYAISLNGAGDQVGRSQNPSFVMSWGSDPSAFMIQICGETVRSEVNAIWLPVGDQVGVTSIFGWLVKRLRFVPSRLTT